MKLAVSNIAWSPAQDQEAFDLLNRHGVRGIEMAPTRQWPDLSLVPEDHILEVRRCLQERGLEAVALQSLLFGKPAMRLLGDEAERRCCAAYLTSILDLAKDLGTGTIVLGSPKNRLRGNLSPDEASDRLGNLLRSLGSAYVASSCTISLEPNPSDYGADFLLTTRETIEFVRRARCPGLRLNFDTGAMCINRENPAEMVAASFGVLGHVHISEPGLADFDTPRADHRAVAEALHSCSYSGWISIEMRMQPNGLEAVARAIDFVRNTYFE